VGINLLREGLDLPEVSLVAILDADKPGYLRSERSLIQTAGRAARHINGEVILYADVKTAAIEALVRTTQYRRKKQVEYNQAHHITPQSVFRPIEESLAVYNKAQDIESRVISETGGDFNMAELVFELEDQMENAAQNLEFERAALLRDQIEEIKKKGSLKTKPTSTY
jgi:excinuclease ABC subunit B